MFNILNLPLDPVEESKIRHRRIQEWQRKARIFNPKQRLIGVDIDSLNQQVHDKKCRETSKKLEEEEFEKEMIQNDQVAVMLEKRTKQQMRHVNEDINKFRTEFQHPATRREFDIHDPDRLKKDAPARVSDDDPRLSVSGLQKLEGEDLNYKERTKEQKKQFCEWMMQQIEEKNTKKICEENMERLFYEQFRDMNLKATELGKAELETERREKINQMNFNKRLAEDILMHKRQEKLQEDQEKLQEIYNMFYSDLLTENPEIARSSFGPHRVIPGRWKGMSPEQLNAIFDAQRYQIMEDQRKKETEAKEIAEWDKLMLHQNRCSILQEREQNRQRKRINQYLCVMNHELAKEQNQRKDFLNKIVYRNLPSEDYFAQFNTTTR